MLYEIRDHRGRSVRVDAGNWMLALGKGMGLLPHDLPDTGEWVCTMRSGGVTVREPATGAWWTSERVADTVGVVAVGPQEILTSLLPDEDEDDDLATAMPPPLLRMPTSVLAPPEEPLFSRADLAEHVFDLSQALMGLPANEACRQALAFVVELVPVEAANVVRGTVADDGLEVVAGFGNGERLLGNRLPFGSGLAGLAHDLAMPVKLDDEKDRRHLHRYDAEYGAPTRGILCVPVMNDGAVYAVIQLVNPPGRFSEDDIEAASCIASTLATALEHGIG